MINSRSIFRIRIQRNKDAWTDPRFESKAEHRDLQEVVTEVLSTPGVADTLAETGVTKAFDVSISTSVTRSRADLELLISCWSVETFFFAA